MVNVTNHHTFSYKFNDTCRLFKQNKNTMISALLSKQIFSLSFETNISNFPQWFTGKNKIEFGRLRSSQIWTGYDLNHYITQP